MKRGGEKRRRRHMKRGAGERFIHRNLPLIVMFWGEVEIATRRRREEIDSGGCAVRPWEGREAIMTRVAAAVGREKVQLGVLEERKSLHTQKGKEGRRRRKCMPIHNGIPKYSSQYQKSSI